MIAVAVMAASGGYFLAMILAPGSAQRQAQPSGISATAMAEEQVQDMLGQRRPDFTLRNSAGAAVSAADFDGSILLVNFWATWCTPCVEEMPMLSALRERYEQQNVEIVGIALDDPQKAGDFAEQLNIAYPVLLGTTDAILVGRQFGNRAGMLPYSVLLDRAGLIQWTHLGALDREELEAQIQALF